MAGSKLLSLRFPAGGVVRRLGYKDQAPYTTPDALNVMPETLPGIREWGGQRPGLHAEHRQGTTGEIGSGNPVRLLADLNVIEDGGRTSWEDDFEGHAVSGVWTEGTWLGTARPPLFAGGLAYLDPASVECALYRDAFSPVILTTNGYFVEMFIQPYEGAYGGEHKIFARMSGTDPTANGIVVTLKMEGTDGSYSGTLKTYASSSETSYNLTSGTNTEPSAGWLRVHITSADVVSVYWKGTRVLSQDISSDSVPAGVVVGFGLAPTVGRVQAGIFRVQYDKTGANQQSRRAVLMASSNGTLYREDFSGDLTAVTSDLTLASDRMIESAERLQKLYIADYGDPKAAGTDGVTGTALNKLDASSVSDWTTKSIDTDDDVLQVYDATEDIIDGTYAISSVAAGEITLGSSIAGGAGAGTCSFRIWRGPKVYDYATDTLSLWMADDGKGQIPSGQPLCCLWSDRLVLAGGADAPHLWYMSRVSAPNDWAYSATDVQQPVAGNNVLAGTIGEPITALMPHEDNCIYFGCRNSLWIMRGNPASGGSISRLSGTVGVVSGNAWCTTPDFQVVFLSQDGVYVLPEVCALTAPQSLSREVLPRDLLDVDPDLNDVSMAYDYRLRGVHIYLTRKDTGKSTHWYLDWDQKSFWSWRLQDDHQPTAVLEHKSFLSGDSAVLLGGKDGFIRRYRREYDNDDGGNTISSHVYYGPFRLGGDSYYDGVLTELVGQTAENGGDVDYEIYVGETEESAYLKTTTNFTGSWNRKGLNYTHYPRARGPVAFLKLKNGEDRTWGIEDIKMKIVQSGKRRLV